MQWAAFHGSSDYLDNERQICFMSAAAVDNILYQIQQLSEDDRLRLQQRLAEISEADWKQEAEKARAIARDEGIDQTAIDQAVKDIP